MTHPAAASRGPRVVVITGPSGAGKTTAGSALAQSLGWRFIEADDYHPPANIARMASGHALTDADRAPWLAALRQVIERVLASDDHAVLACSALAERYREALAPADSPAGAVRFILLVVPEAVLEARVAHRTGHFMPASLVPSQLATLERTDDELQVDGTQAPDAIVREIRQRLGL